MALEDRRIVIEMDRLTGQDHLAVHLHPNRAVAAEDLVMGFADNLFPLQPGQLLEGRIDIQEAVILYLPFSIENSLMEGKSLAHPVEKGTIAGFAFSQGPFSACLRSVISRKAETRTCFPFHRSGPPTTSTGTRRPSLWINSTS